MDDILNRYHTEIEAELQRILADPEFYDPIITPIISEYISRGGKRLRPKMVIITAELTGGLEAAKRSIPTAIVIEILHSASLVHDDICDESSLRRGKPTMHTMYGIPMALVIGDFMLGVLYSVIARNFECTKLDHEVAVNILKTINQSFIDITRGQALEFHLSENPLTATEDGVLQVLELKTAALIRSSIICGAIVGKSSPEQIKALERFSTAAGIAFQIQDDVLNIVGKEEEYGKEIGGDILEGKVTLLLATAIARADQNDLIELHRVYGKPRKERNAQDVKNVIDIFYRTKATETATAMAQKYYEESIQALSSFEESGAKQFLKKMGEFLVKRVK